MSKQNKRKRNKRKKSLIKAFLLLLFSAIIVCVLGVYGYNQYVKSTHPLKYEGIIDKYCSEYGVPKDLIYATIAVESGFDENAVSSVGAIGLTQIMPDTLNWLESKTGEDYTEEDLRNPEISIKYCAFFYSILLNKFDSEDTAVCAYHAGMNQVSRWLENSEYSEDGITLTKIPSSATAHYLSKINNARKIYVNLYNEELKK